MKRTVHLREAQPRTKTEEMREEWWGLWRCVRRRRRAGEMTSYQKRTTHPMKNFLDLYKETASDQNVIKVITDK